MNPVTPPETSEYAPYYDRYISLVKDNDILAALQAQNIRSVLGSVSETQGNLRYAPGKWSIKQVLGHMIDTERIMAYRALRIARGDQTPIEGFEQDDYARNGPFEHCRMDDLLQEFAAVRSATVWLFRSLDREAWGRRGVANKNEITARALAYVIAGHELHHLQILKDKYLPLLRQAG